MTKKHFIALADELRPLYLRLPADLQAELVDTLARFCGRQNPLFDRSRWIGYLRGECGPNGREVRAA